MNHSSTKSDYHKFSTLNFYQEKTEHLQPRYHFPKENDSSMSNRQMNDDLSKAKDPFYSPNISAAAVSPTRKFGKKIDINSSANSKGISSSASTSTSETKSSLVSPLKVSNKLGSLNEVIEPLNLTNLSSLGEPDPTAIARHDLLSAITFDRQGKMLSVGDRGGRIIIFEKTSGPKGIEDFDYLTEF